MSHAKQQMEEAEIDVQQLLKVMGHKIKLRPLKEWICDHCGEVTDYTNGWLEWYCDRNDGGKEGGFRIVHNSRKCFYDSQSMFSQGKSTMDGHIHWYLGPDGLVSLLSFFDYKDLKDPKEFIEIIRRLHVEYYEEARQYWPVAEEDYFFADANEVWPYLRKTSLRIIRDYSSS